jgi:hypothetical protein
MASCRSILEGLAFAALSLTLAGPADARSVKTVEGWELNMTPKTCSMAATFADNVTISLIWAPKTRELGFMAALPHSYGLGKQKTTELDLAFDGDGAYRQWQDQYATLLGGRDSDGVIGNWGAEHSDQLAKAVAAAEHVTVRVGGREVGRYDLAGSPAAYQALLNCGKQLAGK